MTAPLVAHRTPQLRHCRIILTGLTLICLSLFLCPHSSWADEINARIRGTVTDQTGAVMPGVTILVTNLATGFSKQVTSRADGTFEVFDLPAPGTYNITAKKDGFKTFADQALPLSLTQIYVLNIQMVVGAATQSVTVQAHPAQVETTSMELGADIIGISDIPLNGRDWLQLQQTLPGAVASLHSIGDDNVSMNGNREQANNYMVNGTDANDLPLNNPLVIPNPDAIAEVHVITNTMNPEYGRDSGAVLEAVTKSGTNQIHGDLFEFYRDTALNTRNFFNPDKTIFHRNQYGATIGGPIRKDHTFFFFSFQGTDEREPESAARCACSPGGTTVFTAAQRNGSFPDLATSAGESPFPLVGDNGTTYPAGTPYSTIFSTGQIPSADINSLTQNLMNKYVPLPNFGPTEYNFNAVLTDSAPQWLTRIDQNFSSKDNLSGYWFIEKENDIQALPFYGATLPGFAETDSEKINQMSLTWNHTFGSSVQNEARVGYNRLNFVAVSPAQPVSPASAGFTGIAPQSGPLGAGLPTINVTGFFNLGFSIDGPQPSIDQTFQVTDNLSAIKGKHTLKFGFQTLRVGIFNPFYFYNNGQFSFGGAGTFSTGDPGADFLLGIPDSYGQDSGGILDARTHEYYSYAQDQWKIKRNLTLTYGLGWQIDTPIDDKFDGGVAINAFRPGEQSTVFPTAPLGLVFPGDKGVPDPATYRLQWGNFAPRAGFAWEFANKWSLRGGYGIYYNVVEGETQLQNLSAVPFSLFSTGAGDNGAGTVNMATPYSGYGLNPNSGAVIPVSLNNKFPFAPPAVGSSNVDFSFFEPFSINVFAQDYAVPYSQNFNLTLEHELPGSSILSLAYVGSLGRHLENTYELNPAGQAPGVNPSCAADPNCVSLRTIQGFYFPQNFRYDSTIFGSIGQEATDSNSEYNALQISVNKHLSRGLIFLAAYTYSHSIDDSSSFDLSGLANPFNLRGSNRGDSAFDARQRFVLSYVYQFPSARGLGFLKGLPGPLANGWEIAGISTFQQGFPIQFVDSDPRSLLCNQAFTKFGCPDRPDVIAPVQEVSVRTSSLVNSVTTPGQPLPAQDHYFFNPSAFQQEPIGVLGNAGRDFFHGPGICNTDFSLIKNTKIREKAQMQLRVDFFNFFNHTQFGAPVSDINSTDFGRVLTANDSRVIQLGAKIVF